jgi:hypothetical protein
VAKINTGRLIQGGLLAGLVLNGISFLNAVIIHQRLMGSQAAGHFLLTPRFPFYAAWIFILLLVGIALVWLYAAVRPRLGPGPRTALTVGFVAGVLMGVPDNLANAAWGLSGRYLPFMWMLEHVVGCTLGALVGAWWYKEPDAGS